MVPAFEAECVKEAQVRAVTLPSDWSVGGVLEELRQAMMDVQPAVLKTAAALRQSGTSGPMAGSLKMVDTSLLPPTLQK